MGVIDTIYNRIAAIDEVISWSYREMEQASTRRYTVKVQAVTTAAVEDGYDRL